MNKITLIIISCLLVSCSSLPLNSYEKTSLGLNAALQAGDYLSTKEVLDGGGQELNPIYGSNPNDGELIAGKVGGWLLTYSITKCLPSHKSRKVFLNASNVFMSGIVIHNSLQ